ncbi:CHAP domain-containing protein [Kitasatospora sp. NPDC050543]|uniref:CHAP domain-containing protein n=1 Tax=Kitasatospora sp. NPDC050543 TaxID=3364054 RepID=UPI0037A6E8EC
MRRALNRVTPSRLAVTAVLTAAVFGALGSGAAQAATPGSGIASTAKSQLGADACGKNNKGYDGGKLQHNSCKNGREAHAWCADFAGWVWAKNGVKHVDELTDAAASFYTYGVKHKTVHKTPKIGDAIVYNYGGGMGDDHVALVTGVRKNSAGKIVSITVIGGNQGATPGHVTEHANVTQFKVGDAPFGKPISGYVSPVAG